MYKFDPLNTLIRSITKGQLLDYMGICSRSIDRGYPVILVVYGDIDSEIEREISKFC